MKIVESSYGKLEFLGDCILDSNTEGALAILAEEKVRKSIPIVVGLEYMVIPRSEIVKFLRSNSEELKNRYTEIIIYANYSVTTFRELAFTYTELEKSLETPIVVSVQNNNLDDIACYDYNLMKDEKERILRRKLEATHFVVNDFELKNLGLKVDKWARESGLFTKDVVSKNDLLKIISVLKVEERETDQKKSNEYIIGLLCTFNLRRNCVLRGNAFYEILNFMGYSKEELEEKDFCMTV